MPLVETFARFGIGQTELASTTHYSIARQVLDAVALEVTGAQEAPEIITV